MRVIALGTAAAGVPRAGDGGSGYLLEEGDTRLVVDCGPGVLGHLVGHAPLESIDAVFLSHLHHDHVSDLHAFALWARFTKHRLRLFGPPGTRTLLYRWFSLFSNDADPYVQALDIVEVQPWTVHQVGALKIMACPVEHNVACFALRAEAGGKRFVYSGDTRASALLEEAAQDADLFLCEATFQDLEPDRPAEKSRDHHLTAREAGLIAAKARAKRLVLTHLKHDLDPDVSAAQARDGYGAPVTIARVGNIFDI